MVYQWDTAKAEANLKKHGVDFADAAVALQDERALTMEDAFSQGEERFLSLCSDPAGQVIVVIFTWRGEDIRLISARRATRRERRQYEVEP